MWSNNFNSHQVNQFPSPIPRNQPIDNTLHPPYFPQLEPRSTLIDPPPQHNRYSPEDEKRLTDEVIYLHSLWRRGPPSTLNHPRTPHFLRPSIPTPFKRSGINSKTINANIISDKEWPVESKPNCSSSSGSSWPEFKPSTAPVSRPATAEERERVLALKIQLKGLDSCSGLFNKGGGGDGEDEDDDDDEEEDDGDDVKEFEFFMKLFEDDNELRSYYEKNCENGEFYCLVCGALGKALKRKYKNCVALVQHSVTISKTKKRMAHRGYGHVICKVLGWDVNRLPSLPSNVEDASGQSHELQSGTTVIAANCDTNGHGGVKTDGVCQNDVNALLEQKNTLDSVQEVANETGEGCSIPDSKSADCGQSLTGDAAK